jgi:hypothetical protein
MWQFALVRLPLHGFTISAALLSLLATSARAAAPMVEFDVAEAVSCRFVAATDGSQPRAGKTVVEVVFEISTRLLAGKEEDLKHVNYEIVSPEQSLKVLSFLPSTTMICETADGIIQFEEHRAPAELQIEYAGSQAKLRAPLRTPTDTKVSIKKLAPKSLLMASGTIQRAHGVYFRLHPSPQESLQRSHQFVCYFEVPETFRADYVQIVCNAVTGDRSLASVGFAKFNVGLYLEGDAEAKLAVERCSDSQRRLNQAVAKMHAISSRMAAKKETAPNPFTSVLHVVKKEPVNKSRSSERANTLRDVTLSSKQELEEARSALQMARQELRDLHRTEVSQADILPALR